MKVALLHFCFEDYTIELANALSTIVDLTLIQPHKVAEKCRDALNPSINVRVFQKPRIRDPRNVFSMIEMMRIIREVSPDVLHVQETNDFWYDLTLLFNKFPPLVTTIHDVFRHPGDRQTAPGAEYTRRISFYRSHKIIVHAHVLKDALISQFRVSGDRIHVLPHGELGQLYLKRSHANFVNREPHTLLFFGRIWEYKGLRYLLTALPLIAEKIPDVKLIIAGRGEDINSYFPHGYDPNQIEILNDFIPEHNVASLFQRSAVAVLPYIEASQSGVAALAYGLGTPVIASDLGGLREVVHHERDGFLVPPKNVSALAEAVIHYLSSSSIQKDFQAAALKRCQDDLNWLNIAKQTYSIYQQVLQ